MEGLGWVLSPTDQKANNTRSNLPLKLNLLNSRGAFYLSFRIALSIIHQEITKSSVHAITKKYYPVSSHAQKAYQLSGLCFYY